MALIELDGEAVFLQTVAMPGIVVVDCWAAWCGPCRAFAPVFEEAAANHPEMTFAKLDTDANQEVSAALAIQSIPTLLAFRDGILVFRQAGALPGPVFDDLLGQISALDMDEVRRSFEEQREPGAAAAAEEAQAGPTAPADGAAAPGASPAPGTPGAPVNPGEPEEIDPSDDARG
ncbi:Putative thioredoxin 2 [Pseudoclavibacter triregionum]|nr:Putative thioredoxin 2 [Pseudoclavibacter triregionum]